MPCRTLHPAVSDIASHGEHSLVILSVVDPEKVRVENSLNDACKNGNWIPVAILGEEAIYPVGDVESSVGTQSKEVMRGDSLCLASPLEHE